MASAEVEVQDKRMQENNEKVENNGDPAMAEEEEAHIHQDFKQTDQSNTKFKKNSRNIEKYIEDCKRVRFHQQQPISPRYDGNQAIDPRCAGNSQELIYSDYACAQFNKYAQQSDSLYADQFIDHSDLNCFSEVPHSESFEARRFVRDGVNGPNYEYFLYSRFSNQLPSFNYAAVQNNVQESKLDDSMNQLIKHPLQHSWTLWYYEPDRSRSWEDNLNKVSTFNTVEDFWSLFNHIKQPSELKVGADYSMFKDAIRPMWEDKANERGGCWTLAFGRTQRMELDRYWIDTVLCLIGEAFDSINDICGAVVSIRGKGDKIALWTKSVENRDAVMEIGQKLKARLNLPDRLQIQYRSHVDNAHRNSSTVRSLFTL